MDATTTVTHTADPLQELTEAYHAVLARIDALQDTAPVYALATWRVEADRIAFETRDYDEAIARLRALLERM